MLINYYLTKIHNKYELENIKELYNNPKIKKVGAEECPVCNGDLELEKENLPADIGCNCLIFIEENGIE